MDAQKTAVIDSLLKDLRLSHSLYRFILDRGLEGNYRLFIKAYIDCMGDLEHLDTKLIEFKSQDGLIHFLEYLKIEGVSEII